MSLTLLLLREQVTLVSAKRGHSRTVHDHVFLDMIDRDAAAVVAAADSGWGSSSVGIIVDRAKLGCLVTFWAATQGDSNNDDVVAAVDG